MSSIKHNLIEYFEETSNKFPDKMAVIDVNEELTFSQLQKKTKEITR